MSAPERFLLRLAKRDAKIQEHRDRIRKHEKIKWQPGPAANQQDFIYPGIIVEKMDDGGVAGPPTTFRYIVDIGITEERKVVGTMNPLLRLDEIKYQEFEADDKVLVALFFGAYFIMTPEKPEPFVCP